jgi:branched-chain amino acid transport system permease protein
MIVGLGAFLRYARVGVAIRALAENLDRASLLGIGTGAVSSIVWTLAGALSGTSAILLGVLTTPASARSPGPTVLLPALAAAVLARMERLPTAVLASLLLAMVRVAFLYSFRLDAPLVHLAFFAVVVVGLLAQRRAWSRSEEGSGVTWESTREQRAIPRVLAVLPAVRATKIVAAITAVGAVILFPLLATPARVALGSAAALHVIIALSVLVLTGWGGQVSLGQYGFAAIGSLLTAALAATVGLPFFLAIPLGMALTAGVAAVVGIPALRIKGLFLAAATFAFAIAVHSVVLNKRYFGWLIPSSVARPRLLLLDFEDERSMYYLCVLSMVTAILVIGNLRRSRFGRLLIAARENDANLDSLGISAVRLKIIAFALSGGIAGLGGALLTYVLRGVSADAFLPERSITVFMLSVFGGVGSVAGVMLGVAYDELRGVYLQGTGFFNTIFSVIQPFSVLILLFVEPTGLIGLVNRMRDGALRIIAQRRQLVVPSLFADYDPAAIEKRLIPLGARISGSGLAAIRRSSPYTLRSRRYTESGPRMVAGAPPAVDETAMLSSRDVIAAAAKSNEAALAAHALTNGALASTGGTT